MRSQFWSPMTHRTVRNNTIKIAEEIPENKYDFRASPETRTIGQTLVHMALSPSFADHIHSNKIDDLRKVNFPELMQKFGAEEAKPHNKAEIVAFLKSEGERFASFLQGLPDSFLAGPVSMPPGAEPSTKTRFEMLLSPKEHEMHHRGQLMMLQRMIGLVPHLTRQLQERMAQAQQAQGARPTQSIQLILDGNSLNWIDDLKAAVSTSRRQYAAGNPERARRFGKPAHGRLMTGNPVEPQDSRRRFWGSLKNGRPIRLARAEESGV